LRYVPGLTLIQGDLADSARVPGPFEAIVHAAGTSPAQGISSSQIVVDNVFGSFSLINAGLKWRTRYFLFFSSVSIYGEVTDEVLDELSAIHNPDPYGATKFLVESRLMEAAGQMSGLAFRLPGIIGPDARRVWLSGVAARLREGSPIKAFHLDRPFNNAVHVDDIASFVAALLRQGWSGFDTLVLGAAGMTTVRGAIERLAAGLGTPAHIEPSAAVKTSFRLSSERAVARYGYKPMDINSMIDRYARDIIATDISQQI
jgi:nucleoside-diphosphate-sugar epimerase